MRAKETQPLRWFGKQGEGRVVSAVKRRNRGSAYARRDTTHDEEAVSSRRSIAPRNAVKTSGAATAFRVGSDEERESLPSTRGAKRGQNRGRSRADRSRSRRVAQDCAPKAYMHTSSVRMDAQIARPAMGAPGSRPKADIAERSVGRCPESDRTVCWRTGNGERVMGNG